MRKAFAGLVSLVLLSVFGAPAFAGTSSYNSYKTVNEHGSRVTNINVEQQNNSLSVIDSKSIKLEADLGEVNIVNLSFDGSDFTGTAHSSNRVPVDPVVYGTYTNEKTVSTSAENVSVDTLEKVKFDSTEYTHTVGSDY